MLILVYLTPLTTESICKGLDLVEVLYYVSIAVVLESNELVTKSR